MENLPPPNVITIPYNYSYSCEEDLKRDSCFLTSVQLGEYDSIAAVRMVVSCLSIIGAISIVTWAVVKKQVWSPKVHPIFVLSLADTILGTLFLIGGSLWLRRAPSRVGCFAVSLPTVILECVTVNLTVVYALLAYAGTKKKTINNLLMDDRDRVWSPLKNLIVYLIAWITPIVMVMILFVVVDSQTNLIHKANKCSCYCLPVLGNIIPFVLPRDEGSAMYNRAARGLVLTYGIILVLHYLVCFILLCIIYYKLLKYIRRIRREFETVHTDSHKYGATGTLLIQGESKARKRVVYFMTVFVANGFFNFLLAVCMVGVEAKSLGREPHIVEDLYFRIREQSGGSKFITILLILQSLSVPLQGFLNALVYGWTREDFLTVMAAYSKYETLSYQSSNKAELEESAEFEGTAFTEEQVSMVNKMTNNFQNPRKNKGRRNSIKESVGLENRIQATLAPVETGCSDSEYEDR